MTSMAPFFNVAPRFAMPELPGLPVSEEDRQRALLRNAYDSAAPRGPVPAMMNALSALRDMPEAAPAPRMVSGGDVIGLMPEQSEALMDRIQRQNEIDQKMYEQRSLQSREEAMTREGRVMSAREAQQRRAEEFAIEKAKLDREDERDKAKMSRPTYQPISSNPGYLMKIQTNPDTNEVTAEVVKAGGTDLPAKAPKMGWVKQADGSREWRALEEGTKDAPQAFRAEPNEQARVIEMLNKSTLTPEERDNVYGLFLKTGELPNLEFEEKDTGFTNITVTEPDGRKVIKRVPTADLVGDGIQTAPPKGDSTSKPLLQRVADAVRDLKATGRVEGDDFKENMRALVESGAFTEAELTPIYKVEAESGNAWNTIKSLASGALDTLARISTGQIGGTASPASKTTIGPDGQTYEFVD